MANRKRLKNPLTPDSVLKESAAVGQEMEELLQNGSDLAIATDISALVNILAEKGFIVHEEWIRRSMEMRKAILVEARKFNEAGGAAATS